MATAVQHIESRNTTDQVKDKAEFLPDIVEERRKDSDGRISVNRFTTGKLLGKVKHLFVILINCCQYYR
jgi:hypothetical protein